MNNIRKWEFKKQVPFLFNYKNHIRPNKMSNLLDGNEVVTWWIRKWKQTRYKCFNYYYNNNKVWCNVLLGFIPLDKNNKVSSTALRLDDGRFFGNCKVLDGLSVLQLSSFFGLDGGGGWTQELLSSLECVGLMWASKPLEFCEPALVCYLIALVGF